MNGFLMMRRKSTSLVMAAGLMSVGLGMVYILNLPELTHDATPTTMPWGYLTICLGFAAFLLSVLGSKTDRRSRAFMAATLGAIALLQLPAVFAWFMFHGRVISDGPVGPIGNWLWSVPHIFLAVMSVYSAILTW